MNQTQFESDALTDEQRKAMKDLQERSGVEWEKFLEMSSVPCGSIAPYVGVNDFHGMFVGIEPDGYTHS